MLELWGGDKRILDVTIYDLMHMKGGLNDYDDGLMLKWTIDHPNEDFEVLDYLHTLNKTFVCNPGECEYYSSVGVQILALVLA